MEWNSDIWLLPARFHMVWPLSISPGWSLDSLSLPTGHGEGRDRAFPYHWLTSLLCFRLCICHYILSPKMPFFWYDFFLGIQTLVWEPSSQELPWASSETALGPVFCFLFFFLKFRIFLTLKSAHASVDLLVYLLPLTVSSTSIGTMALFLVTSKS